MSPFVSSFFKKCSIAVSYVAIPCFMSVLVLQSGATNVSKLCLGRVSIKFFFFFGGTHMGCAGMSQLVYMVRRWSPVLGGYFLQLDMEYLEGKKYAQLWRERTIGCSTQVSAVGHTFWVAIFWVFFCPFLPKHVCFMDCLYLDGLISSCFLYLCLESPWYT